MRSLFNEEVREGDIVLTGVNESTGSSTMRTVAAVGTVVDLGKASAVVDLLLIECSYYGTRAKKRRRIFDVIKILTTDEYERFDTEGWIVLNGSV